MNQVDALLASLVVLDADAMQPLECLLRLTFHGHRLEFGVLVGAVQRVSGCRVDLVTPYIGTHVGCMNQPR